VPVPALDSDPLDEADEAVVLDLLQEFNQLVHELRQSVPDGRRAVADGEWRVMSDVYLRAAGFTPAGLRAVHGGQTGGVNPPAR